MTRYFLGLMILLSLAATPVAAAGKSEEKREKILDMREDVLEELYGERPQTLSEIGESEGYAVFSNVGVQVLLLGGGGGRGVVHDNRTGEDTFMKMATASVGLGLGIKDFRAVFVFHDRDAMTSFVEKGWDFAGEADAAARSSDKGGEISEAGTFSKRVSVYQFTKNGLALQASLHGTKYWKDKKLNR